MISFNSLVLGTAMWGWGIPEKQRAFEILDAFSKTDGRVVDTAWNYPIDKNKEHFNLAVKWLGEWNRHNQGQLKFYVKIGTISNDGSPEINLDPQNLIEQTNKLKEIFGDSLYGVGIHWDNRNSLVEIEETVSGLFDINESYNIKIGLSGIVNPILYKNLGIDSILDHIQVKENPLVSNRNHYIDCFPKAKFWAYGIYFGGGRNDKSNINNNLSYINLIQTLKRNNVSIRNDFHACLYYAILNKNNDKIILGPKSLDQLNDIIKFVRYAPHLNPPIQ